MLLHQAYHFLIVEEEFRMRLEEEELGLGHVHKTGSVVCWQIQR